MAKKLSELYAVSEVSFTKNGNEILELWHLFDDDAPPDEVKIDWLYLNNPEGEGKAVGLLHRPDSHLAGVMCFSRRTLHYGQSTYNGCLIADLIIEPKHRALGPFRLISEKGKKLALDDFEIMYGFPIVTAPTPNLGDIIERNIDYSDNVLPLNLVHFLERRVPRPVARLVAALVQPARRLSLDWALRPWRRRFSEVKKVDSAFIDALWARTRSANRLQAMRSGANVFWRLDQPPFQNSLLLGLNDADGRPAAMAIYQVGENGVAHIIDLCWVDLEFSEVTLNILARTLMAAGAVSLSLKLVESYVDFAAMIKQLGFRSRRSRTLRLIAQPEYSSVVNSDEIWIQPLDNDYA